MNEIEATLRFMTTIGNVGVAKFINNLTESLDKLTENNRALSEAYMEALTCTEPDLKQAYIEIAERSMQKYYKTTSEKFNKKKTISINEIHDYFEGIIDKNKPNAK